MDQTGMKLHALSPKVHVSAKNAPRGPQCFSELSYLVNLFVGTVSFKACWEKREYQLMYTLQIWWVGD